MHTQPQPNSNSDYIAAGDVTSPIPPGSIPIATLACDDGSHSEQHDQQVQHAHNDCDDGSHGERHDQCTTPVMTVMMVLMAFGMISKCTSPVMFVMMVLTAVGMICKCTTPVMVVMMVLTPANGMFSERARAMTVRTRCHHCGGKFLWW